MEPYIGELIKTSYELLTCGVTRYQCEEGADMEGSRVLYCDGGQWNGTAPTCQGIYIMYCQ